MDKKPENKSKPIIKPVQAKLPPQKSPTDLSNWQDRTFKTPNGRLVIETDQTNNNTVIAE